MATRRRNIEPPALADLEGANNPAEAPGIMPPPGTEAQVETKIRYQRTIVDPEDYYSKELRDLAEEEERELPTPNPPSDPLTEFCSEWRNFAGYSLNVIRLPDPANKRMPGQAYNNTCLEITSLGSLPFDPNNIVPTLQLINGNSGGAFRLFLKDENGELIPGARLDRILIPDPPKAYNDRARVNTDYPYGEYPQVYQRQPPQPPPLPQKSETELYIEQMQRELFQKVMMRALDPPAPPIPDPLAALPADTRLALGLLQEGDVLKTAISRITDLAQAPDRIESSTWKDKLADAGLHLVTNNPDVVKTATDIISRAVMAIATAFAPRVQQSQVISEPIPVQHPPAQRVPAPAIQPAQNIPGLPETPQDDETDEDVEIDMMEDIVKLLLSDKPLALNDPAILDIRETYPEIFQKVMVAVATIPSASLIQYVCSQSEFCADLFNSERNGPHLRARLEELKLLLQNTHAPTETQNPNPAEQTPA